ncbi:MULTISPECIES: hypothetical protein [Legionella]|uniref:Uncharacterized protein n=1 Tax=Legionella maceachernii TaxID=466 RepID=A0A0W0W4R2_9GAMM|nr:hypothetical protein [Legionella maceachernii]KTD27171.1 hypothetical protein Lmac_1419 [Legionella maceachernii]SKA13612.1 hypothetical protein SAMN02745128_02237 [Legionella maceachernii]SUP04797.1 Uncharacterised protein [Legionella maceachernii]
MKLINAFIMALVCFFGSTQSFAAKKILTLGPPPRGLECQEIYEIASPPKSTQEIFNSTQSICTQKGGLNVLSETYGDLRQPQGVILSCVGDTPNRVVFACYFPAN